MLKPTTITSASSAESCSANEIVIMTSEAADPIDIEVGQRLRAFRHAKKMSQSAIADACSISFQQVQTYERGANRISASMMCRLAVALEIDPADLLPPSARNPDAKEVDLAALQSKEFAEAARLLSELPPKARRAAVSMLRLIVVGEHDRHDLES